MLWLCKNEWIVIIEIEKDKDGNSGEDRENSSQESNT